MVMEEAAVQSLESVVWGALQDVKDPEIPAVSVVELGVVRSVDASTDRIRVELLPTFVGCPALDVMRDAVHGRLAGFAQQVEVEISFAEPWTSDRITAEGRRKLSESGFAPPDAGGGAASLPIALLPVATCPFCGSRRTVLENAFGPTQCRAIQYCTECRQPFEQFKTV